MKMKWIFVLVGLTGMPIVQANTCRPPDPQANILTTDWGLDLENSRYQTADKAGLSVQDVPHLKLAWAFRLNKATDLRVQPVVTTDTVYVGGGDKLYALSSQTGCIRWQQNFKHEVRTPLMLARLQPRQPPRLLFGDDAGNVYAIDIHDGSIVWQQSVSTHFSTKLTGSFKFYQGRVYVPVSSQEEFYSIAPFYPCCSFRGAVAALDAADGKLLWRTYLVPEAQALDRNWTMVKRWGPSGVAVWSSPAIDTERRLLIVATGNNYEKPTTDMSDAIIAMNLDTGKIRWARQITAGDAWGVGCALPAGGCPQKPGYDFDFGAAPVLGTLPDGRAVVFAGQKSAIAYALDRNNGAVIWQTRVGRGGATGGIHWGIARDEQRLYVPNSDFDLRGYVVLKAENPPGEKKPGMNALDLATGKLLWHTAEPFPCGKSIECDNGLSAPPTVIPGVVFAGSMQGMLNAYAATTGHRLWQADTTHEVAVVNGGTGNGGAIDVQGPVIAGGRLYVLSGYGTLGKRGNLLLVYAAAAP
jgi:polyvinyl alcohol dehydrogenase (cytochrome)